MQKTLEQLMGDYAMGVIEGDADGYEQFLTDAAALRDQGIATQDEIERAIARTDDELADIGF